MHRKVGKIIMSGIILLLVMMVMTGFNATVQPTCVEAVGSVFADLNNDGNVDSRDLGKLQRIISGTEVYDPQATETPAVTPTPVITEAYNTRTCSIFQTVCCIGDSATSGHIDYGYASDGTLQEGVRVRRNEDYAWPAFMEKITGNEYINLGISGATVFSWLESAKFSPLRKTIEINASWNDKDPVSGERVTGSFKTTVTNTDEIQAYLIGLGMNDTTYVSVNNSSQKVLRLELGSPSDIGTEAETFYGSYSRLIENIYSVSPKAKIFVQTMHENLTDERYAYNDAIRYIANYYKTRTESPIAVHVLDLYEYREMYKIDSIKNDRLGGHWTAVSYQQFAEILCRIWSEYINTHLDDFKDVHLITD